VGVLPCRPSLKGIIMVSKIWQWLSGKKTYILMAVLAVGSEFMLNNGYTAEQITTFNLIMTGLFGVNKVASTIVPKEVK
jgi:hypothetical protein